MRLVSMGLWERLSRYRFRHHFFKNILEPLDGVEVAHLHQEVGKAFKRLMQR